MDPSLQGHHQAAAEAFMESLNQLEHSLQEQENDAAQTSAASKRSIELLQQENDRIDLEALESAAADIEQFMQTKNSSLDE